MISKSSFHTAMIICLLWFAGSVIWKYTAPEDVLVNDKPIETVYSVSGGVALEKIKCKTKDSVFVQMDAIALIDFKGLIDEHPYLWGNLDSIIYEAGRLTGKTALVLIATEFTAEEWFTGDRSRMVDTYLHAYPLVKSINVHMVHYKDKLDSLTFLPPLRKMENL